MPPTANKSLLTDALQGGEGRCHIYWADNKVACLESRGKSLSRGSPHFEQYLAKGTDMCLT